MGSIKQAKRWVSQKERREVPNLDPKGFSQIFILGWCPFFGTEKSNFWAVFPENSPPLDPEDQESLEKMEGMESNPGLISLAFGFLGRRSKK